jgi:hypothetical protein
MAIAFDAASSGKLDASSGYSLSFSHTNAGNFIYVVADGKPNTVTYGGEALTFIELTQSTFVSLWYKLSPLSGANDVAVTWPYNDRHTAIAVTLSGVNTLTPLGARNRTYANGNTPSVSFTTTYPNSLVIDAFRSTNNVAPSAGAGQTSRQALYNTNGGFYLYTSTEPTTTAGATEMSWSLGSAQDWSGIAQEIREPVSTIFSPIII